MFEVPNHSCFYKPDSGSYGIICYDDNDVDVDDVEWYSCRETFEDVKYKKFLFVHKKGERSKIIKFIDKVQDKIKLPKKDRIKISPTDKNYISYVEVSKFWSANFKYSLLTILLRAGRGYRRSFEKAIEREDYLRETLPAVNAFLSGRTKITSPKDFYGWRDTFVDMEEKDVLKRLKKRKKSAN